MDYKEQRHASEARYKVGDTPVGDTPTTPAFGRPVMRSMGLKGFYPFGIKEKGGNDREKESQDGYPEYGGNQQSERRKRGST